MRIKHKHLITKENEKAVSSPGCIYTLFKNILNTEDILDREKEHFWVIGLTFTNKIKYIELVHLGTVNKSIIGIKDILRTAVYYCCSNIIICHNHPGGSITPSDDDIKSTNALKKGAETLEINLLDSIIVGADEYFGFKENGLM